MREYDAVTNILPLLTSGCDSWPRCFSPPNDMDHTGTSLLMVLLLTRLRSEWRCPWVPMPQESTSSGVLASLAIIASVTPWAPTWAVAAMTKRLNRVRFTGCLLLVCEWDAACGLPRRVVKARPAGHWFAPLHIGNFCANADFRVFPDYSGARKFPNPTARLQTRQRCPNQATVLVTVFKNGSVSEVALQHLSRHVSMAMTISEPKKKKPFVQSAGTTVSGCAATRRAARPRARTDRDPASARPRSGPTHAVRFRAWWW